MSTSYTPLLGLALPVQGELAGTWGDVVSNYITSYLDSAVAGTQTITTDADVTLTKTTNASLGATSSQYAILNCTGARTALRTITAPAASKIYMVINATTGGYSVKLVGAGPTTGLTIPNGASAVVAWNGTDFVEIGSGTIGNLTVNGNLSVTGNTTLGDAAGDTTTVSGPMTLSAGTANGVLYLNASKVATSGSALVFDGSNLGLGVTPSTWWSTSRAIQFGNGGSVNGRTNNAAFAEIGANVYLDSSAVPTYIASAAASRYQQSSGAHYWYYAASGTAGAAITFTQAMTLDASGNLGIGTTSPQGKLNVAGYTSVSGDAEFQLTRTSSSTSIGQGPGIRFNDGTTNNTRIIQNGSGNLQFWHYNGSWQTEMTLDSSGNLGIGTSSPLSRLDVREANRANSTNITNIGVYTTTAQAVDVGGTIGLGGIFDASTGYAPFGSIRGGKENSTVNNYAGYLAFQTIANGGSLTERMRLDSSGNLGIGTSSPAQKLHVATAGNNYIVSHNTAGSTSALLLGAESGLNAIYSWTTVAGSTGRPLAFFTGASEAMRLDTSGNLGIGTSSPVSQLTVGAATANPASTVSVFKSTVDEYRLKLTSSGFNADTKWLGLGFGYSDNYMKAAIIAEAKDGNARANLHFALNDAASSANASLSDSKMVLTYTGNLGLGVTPSAWGLSGVAALQIKNAGYWGYLNRAYMSANMYIDSGGSTRYIASDYATYYAQLNGTHAWLTAPSGTAGNTMSGANAFVQAMTLDASGNLNLTSPATNIYIQPSTTTNNALIRAINAGGTAYIGLDTNAGGLGGQYSLNLWHSGAYPIVFATNNTERARIDSSGDLLVGTTSQLQAANSRLNVAGDFYNANGVSLKTTNGGASAQFIGFLNESGTLIGSIQRNSTTNAVLYNTTSDQRLKSNVEDAAPVLDKLMQVQVRQYDWTEGNVHQDYGFIAQELEPVLSGVVTRGRAEDDLWQLDYSKLTPHLVKAIQELKAEVDSLKAQLKGA